MGTLVLSEIRSRKQMIDHLTARNNGGYKVLDHSARSNILYTLEQHPDGYRFIGVHKMIAPSSRDRTAGWGYKSMSESEYPYYFDCPERILKHSDVEDSSGWREACRKLRRKKSAMKTFRLTVRHGTTLQMCCGWKFNEDTGERERQYEDVIYDYNLSPTYFAGHRPNESQQYRIRWEDIRLPEEFEMLAA